MRIGLISDIHANYEALTSSIAAVKNAGADHIVCLGDIVGYGADPVKCIETLQKHKIKTVQGNHDYYTTSFYEKGIIQEDINPHAKQAIKWTSNQLKKEHIQYLKSLPANITYENIAFTHSSLENVDGEYWPYILDSKTARLQFCLQDYAICFTGHTHIPVYFELQNNYFINMQILTKLSLDFKSVKKYIINTGSVGQPRDADPRGAAAIFDLTTRQVESLRFSYDIKKSQKKIVKEGLPEVLAERLSFGI